MGVLARTIAVIDDDDRVLESLQNRTRLRNAPFLLLSICDGLCL